MRNTVKTIEAWPHWSVKNVLYMYNYIIIGFSHLDTKSYGSSLAYSTAQFNQLTTYVFKSSIINTSTPPIIINIH